MSQSSIPKALRDRVAEQARHRCGYCLSAEAIVGTNMEMDHLLPESLGGLSEEENLWLACARCNAHKSDRIAAADPETGQMVHLFHPCRQSWAEHFHWSPDGERIDGLTPEGRATVAALQLNRKVLVDARRLWVQVGWHPPRDLGS